MPSPLSEDHVAPNSSTPPRWNTADSENSDAAPPMLSTGRYQAEREFASTKNRRDLNSHTCERSGVETPVMAGVLDPSMAVQVVPS